MAISILLTTNKTITKHNEHRSFYFEDSGADYWYLWPTMIKEINNKTGELIDLYQDAEFSGSHLTIFKTTVAKHLAVINSKKEKSWEVYIGTQMHPVKQDIYKTLVKKEIAEKLEKLLQMIDLAIKSEEKIICIGD
ncbi:hypothetical protein [Flavobacterium cerinum]|uniref:Uncharacterized protein n=1 Tax=Flavobacterium cerinum TaxID=2502784 RepID=A0ABY5ISR0_9FLAO|nr:hypothetical protein [Flavobacterium cerinum]UUC45187.1 hypothetical protein NOX80_16370 [Flavobacterium cerinum]